MGAGCTKAQTDEPLEAGDVFLPAHQVYHMKDFTERECNDEGAAASATYQHALWALPSEVLQLILGHLELKDRQVVLRGWCGCNLLGRVGWRGSDKVPANQPAALRADLTCLGSAPCRICLLSSSKLLRALEASLPPLDLEVTLANLRQVSS